VVIDGYAQDPLGAILPDYILIKVFQKFPGREHPFDLELGRGLVGNRLLFEYFATEINALIANKYTFGTGDQAVNLVMGTPTK